MWHTHTSHHIICKYKHYESTACKITDDNNTVLRSVQAELIVQKPGFHIAWEAVMVCNICPVVGSLFSLWWLCQRRRTGPKQSFVSERCCHPRRKTLTLWLIQSSSKQCWLFYEWSRHLRIEWNCQSLTYFIWYADGSGGTAVVSCPCSDLIGFNTFLLAWDQHDTQ